MLELDIMNFVRKKLSPLAMPQEIEFVPGLPKPRSGKIIRRVLRAQEGARRSATSRPWKMTKLKYSSHP
jgi:acyl-coenzyme A synthetase/AMP-(fatty) acid ligase